MDILRPLHLPIPRSLLSGLLAAGIAAASASAEPRVTTGGLPSGQLQAWERDGRELPTIAPYRDGMAGAVSLTFDDGFVHQVDNALEILDPLGVKGTFFLIPLRIDAGNKSSIGWQKAKEMVANGHEIGTHGAVSEKLHEVSDERLDELVNGSHDLILEHVGVDPVSYAAPGGSKLDERVMAVVHEKHPVVRNASVLPKAKTAGYGSVNRRVWEDEKARQMIRQNVDGGGWVIPYIHAIVKGYSPFKSKDEFRGHVTWLTEQEDIWLAPMGVVGLYVLAREDATLELLELEPGKVSFRLAVDNPHPPVRETPLSIAIPAPGATEVAFTGPNADQATSVLRDGIIYATTPPGELTVHWR